MSLKLRNPLLAVGVAFLVVSCDAGQPTAFRPTTDARAASSQTSSAPAPTHAPQSVQGGLFGHPLTVFACAADSITASDSANIGPLGGTLHFGGNTLIVPPGAVFRTTKITATDPGDGHVSAVFQPEGLHFLVPAILTMKYSQCSPPPTGSPSIVYLKGLLDPILEILPTTIDLKLGTAIAPVSHFSVYALAD
jgi:hypothetical protein